MSGHNPVVTQYPLNPPSDRNAMAQAPDSSRDWWEIVGSIQPPSGPPLISVGEMEVDEDPWEEGRIAAQEQEAAQQLDRIVIENVATAGSSHEQNVAVLPPAPDAEALQFSKGTEHQLLHDRLLHTYFEDEPTARILLDDLHKSMIERVHHEMDETMRLRFLQGQ